MSRSRTHGPRLLAGVLLAVTVARTQTDAAAAWIRFGSIDILTAAVALLAAGATVTPVARGPGAGVPGARVVAGAAAAACALGVARIVLTALGVGLPIGAPHSIAALDAVSIAVATIALGGVAVLAWPARRVPRRRIPAVELSRAQLAAIALVVATGAFVSLYRLGTPSWIIDELFYRSAGLAYFAHDNFSLNREHVFLAKDLIGASQLVFGSGPAAVRLPSAIAGLLTGGVLLAIGRHVSGLLAGTLAFAAWTLIPHPVYSDVGNVAVISIERYALLDPLMVLFLAVALGCGWRWIETGSWRWALGLGIAGGVSIATKATAVCVFPALVVCGLLLTRGNRRGVLIQAVAIVASAALVVLASYLPPLGDSLSSVGDMLHLQHVHSLLGHPVVIDGHVYARAPWWAHLWWQWHSTGPIATTALLICALLAPLYVGWRVSLYLWVAVVVPLVYLSLFVDFGLPHYYIVWQAPLALLAALGLAALWRAGRAGRLAGAPLAAALAVTMVATVAAVASLRPNDYAAAGRLLARDGPARANVAVWFAPALLAPYLPRASIVDGPRSGVQLDAIVVDPNYALTIANRPLQAYLFLAQRNFTACRVNRLTLYLRRSSVYDRRRLASGRTPQAVPPC